MASVYFSVCHSRHNFVCAGITKLAVKTKADLQKRGSMEPMEPPLDPPLRGWVCEHGYVFWISLLSV